MMKDEALNSKWRPIKQLGEGSFSRVILAKSLEDKKLYAIKCFKETFNSFDEVNHMREVMAYRTLQGYPHIIQLKQVIFDNRRAYLVLELMEENLYQFLVNTKTMLSEKQALLLIYQLLQALDSMHSLNLFHRDIKPENCLVDPDTFVLKLGDLGSTVSMSNTRVFTEYVATRWYRAPECILTSGFYGPSVDIWAVGCILYEVITKTPLFPGKKEMHQIMLIHKVLGSPNRSILDKFKQKSQPGIEYSFPFRVKQDLSQLLPNSSPEIVDLLSKMLVYDPDGRITARQALYHPAFELFRNCESLYEKSSKSIPFPLFVLKTTENIPLFKRDIVENTPISPDNSFIKRAIMEQDNEIEKAKEANQHKKLDLLAMRRETAERIKNNQKKMMINSGAFKAKKIPAVPKKPVPPKVSYVNGLQFGKPRVIKHIVQPKVGTINPYQKPSVNLLKLQIKPQHF